MRRSTVVPYLFILCVEAMLLGLGFWQMHRLAWKNAVIAEITAAQSEPAMTELPSFAGDGASLHYRKATLTGHWAGSVAMLRPSARPGERAGYDLLTPLILEDGQVILVDRGFVRGNHMDVLGSFALGTDAVQYPFRLTTGDVITLEPPVKADKTVPLVHVEGILRAPRGQGLFTPHNRPEQNLWLWEDLAAMRDFTHLPLGPLILQRTGASIPGEFPMPYHGSVMPRSDHLQYAVTWFSLAAIILGMFVVYQKRKPLPEHAS